MGREPSHLARHAAMLLRCAMGGLEHRRPVDRSRNAGRGGNLRVRLSGSDWLLCEHRPASCSAIVGPQESDQGICDLRIESEARRRRARLSDVLACSSTCEQANFPRVGLGCAKTPVQRSRTRCKCSLTRLAKAPVHRIPRTSAISARHAGVRHRSNTGAFPRTAKRLAALARPQTSARLPARQGAAASTLPGFQLRGCRKRLRASRFRLARGCTAAAVQKRPPRPGHLHGRSRTLWSPDSSLARKFLRCSKRRGRQALPSCQFVWPPMTSNFTPFRRR